jgi:hypothetical protein
MLGRSAGKGRFKACRLPADGRHRDFPAPEGRTFQAVGGAERSMTDIRAKPSCDDPALARARQDGDGREAVMNGSPTPARVDPPRASVRTMRTGRRCSWRWRHGDATVERVEARMTVPGRVATICAPQPAAFGRPRRRSLACGAALGQPARAGAPAGTRAGDEQPGSAAPSPESRKAERWCWPPAPTIRHVNFLPEHAHRGDPRRYDIAGDYETALGANPQSVTARGGCTRRQHDHRAVALGRHPADPAARRAWDRGDCTSS